MSKKLIAPTILTATMASVMLTGSHKNSYSGFDMFEKQQGSAIYIPKRHKFKPRNKR